MSTFPIRRLAPVTAASEVFADAIAAEGTTAVFGVLGDGNMIPLLDLIERHDVRYIAARSELAAVAMADGYSRATGRVGVCATTQGPGLTHAMSSLMTAVRNQSQVVLFCGDTAPGARLHPQHIDQRSIVAAAGATFVDLRDSNKVDDDVRRAFHYARSGHGPAVLNFNTELQARAATGPTHCRALPEWLPPTASPAAIDRLAAVLTASRRPVLLAGQGAVASGARAAILDLANRVGALVSTTLLAKGWLQSDPFDLGVAGGFGSPAARALFAEADLVVVLGAGLNRFTTDSGRLFPNAIVAHIDIDRTRIGQTTPVGLAVTGDVRLVVEELLDCLHPSGSGWRTPDTKQRIDEPDARLAERGAFTDGEDPRAVISACNEALREPYGIAVDIGRFAGWVAQHLAISGERNLVLPWELGCVGLALPAAIGAAIGRPEQPWYAFVGDGGLMMSLLELETAVRESIPIVVVVLDDGAYGAEVHLLERAGRRPTVAEFTNPSFAECARALGAAGWTARDSAHLEQLLPTKRQAGPTLIHVPITGQVTHTEIFAGLEG